MTDNSPDSPTLLRGGRIHTGEPGSRSDATAMVVAAGRIVAVGAEHEFREGWDGEVVDLDGALVTPAFVDSHVHATATGLMLDGLDLTECGSLDECLRAVAEHTSRPGTAGAGAVVWGHGWDETTWPQRRPPTSAELDAAAGGRPVYLSRIDMHSAVVTSDLATTAAGTDGYAPSGVLSRQAHHAVRKAAPAMITTAQRGAAQRAFLDAAAAHGIGCVHECAGPDISSVDDLRELLDPAVSGQGETTTAVVGYWGELAEDAEHARALLAATGAHGLAGDLFCDGAVGSRTAAMCQPYADAPDTSGFAYLDASAITRHVLACTEAGAQAGFHVIGDAATEAVVAGLRAAHERSAGVSAARHRLEHLEMVSPEQAAALAELGVCASVQPGFDAAWGGPDGMYAARLGQARAEPMNPLAMLAAAGVPLAFGSDTPVTPLGPWAAVRAATRHRTPASSLGMVEAMRAHTAGGHHAAAARGGDGTLRPGQPATYAVWDVPGPLDEHGLPDLDHGLPRCRRTVVGGNVIHDRDGDQR